MFLPYFALFNAAFSPIATTLVTPANATLHNIHFIFFELSSTQLALKNTFILGAAAATLGTVLALVIAYSPRARRSTGHRALGFLATAPIAIPGIVLGVGLFLSYTRPPLRALRHALGAADRLSSPSSCRPPISSCNRRSAPCIPSSRTPAASSAPRGCRRLRQITAPLLRTSVIATWCFIFVGVIRELSAAIMLFTSETKVVSVLIFDLKESGDLGAISVLGLSMLVLTFAVVIVVNRMPGFGGAPPAQHLIRP